METRCDDKATERYDDTNLKLISLAFGSSGSVGIRLSKSSWDPFPFVSHVDEESTAQERGLQVGDCILKVDKKNMKRLSRVQRRENVSRPTSTQELGN